MFPLSANEGHLTRKPPRAQRRVHVVKQVVSTVRVDVTPAPRMLCTGCISFSQLALWFARRVSIWLLTAPCARRGDHRQNFHDHRLAIFYFLKNLNRHFRVPEFHKRQLAAASSATKTFHNLIRGGCILQYDAVNEVSWNTGAAVSHTVHPN